MCFYKMVCFVKHKTALMHDKNHFITQPRNHVPLATNHVVVSVTLINHRGLASWFLSVKAMTFALCTLGRAYMHMHTRSCIPLLYSAPATTMSMHKGAHRQHCMFSTRTAQCSQGPLRQPPPLTLLERACSQSGWWLVVPLAHHECAASLAVDNDNNDDDSKQAHNWQNWQNDMKSAALQTACLSTCLLESRGRRSVGV